MASPCRGCYPSTGRARGRWQASLLIGGPALVMSSSVTAVRRGHRRPHFNDRRPYYRDASTQRRLRTPTSTAEVTLGRSRPAGTVRARPTAHSRATERDGLISRSHERGGEVLWFGNPCTSSPTPFRGLAGLYMPPYIPQTPMSRELLHGFMPAYAIRLQPNAFLNEATKAGTHGKSTYKHGTLRAGVDHPHA